MVLYDISMAIEPNMAVYKNKDEKKPRLETVQDFETGSAFESRLAMDMHTGTHIDMPLHMIPSGSTSDSWSAGNMFTACTVLDFTDQKIDSISADDLRKKEIPLPGSSSTLKLGRTVLLKTRNSLHNEFDYSFVYLDLTGARYLVEKGLVGVGIDALGIERDQPNHDTHKTLLGANIWIVEGLRLDGVPEGEYILAIMPLKIMAVEALPARAVLLDAGSFAGGFLWN